MKLLRVLSLLIVAAIADAQATELVGALPGDFSVSQTGSAAYRIPIDMPRATGGLRPNVSLLYNHKGGNGIAGQGWTIGGMSRISRCPQTFAQDDAIVGVEYTLDDKFCLDGQRLMVISGTYGAASSEYRTEIESFQKIIAYNQKGNGPQYFIVTSKNGTKHYYGHINESSLTYTYSSTYKGWFRYRIEDTFGNQINYFYDANDTTGEQLIEKIEYTANTGESLTARYRVNFTYGTRPTTDQRSGYVFGAIWSKTKRLTEIAVEGYKGVVWESISDYTLTYQTGDSGRSQLLDVERSRGTDNLPSTDFVWQDAVEGWEGAVSDESSSAHTYPRPGDFNGDGQEDLFVVKDGKWHVLPASGGSFGTAIDTGKTATNAISSKVLDFNGDNKADLIFTGTDGDWHVYISTGTGFTEIDTGKTAGTAGVAQDVDGDGLDDILYKNGLTIRMRRSTGTGLGDEETLLTFGAPTSNIFLYGKIHYGLDNQIDFNGDGRGDLVVKDVVPGAGGPRGGGGGPVHTWVAYIYDGTNYVSAGIINTSTVPKYTDINGDGLDDVTYYDISGSAYKTQISKGNVLVSSVTSSISDSNFSDVMFADYDGDGREDLLRATATAWYVHISDGDSYDTTGVSITAPDPQGTNFAMDVSGSGFDELVVDESSYWKIQDHKSSVVDVITKFTDGLGNYFEPSYTSINDMTDYTYSASPTFPDQRETDAIYVVDEYDANDGIGGLFTNDIKYWDALRHAQGRGFLGFDKRRLIDDRNDIYREEEYRQDFPYIGGLEKRTVNQSEAINKDIEVTDPTWATTTIGTGEAAREFARIETTTTTTYEVGGADNGLELLKVVSNPTYETTYGNPTSRVITTTSPDYTGSFVTTLDYEYENYTTPWCVSLVKKITVTKSAPSSTTDSRISQRTFNSSDCRLLTVKDTSDTETTKQLIATLTHDGFGNVTQASYDSVQGSIADRVTAIDYDTYGQYPEIVERKIDSLTNPEVERTWDYLIGRPLSVTNAQGQETSWLYDNFGRMTKETRPDGTDTDFSYVDCVDCWITGRGKFYVQTDEFSGFQSRDYRDRFGRSIGGWQHLPEGKKSNTEIEYNDTGRVDTLTGPWVDVETGFDTVYDYDLIGRVIEIDRPISESTTSGSLTTIDRERLTHEVTNAENQVTTYDFDSIARIVQVTDDDLGDTDYTYTVFSQPDKVTDPDDAETTIVYDDRGFKTSMTVPDMGTWEYDYNVFGELIWQEDAKLQEIDFVYNQLGLLTSRDEEIEGVTTYSYFTTSDEKLWLPSSVSSPGGFSESYSYDTLSRQSSVSTTISSTAYVTDFDYHSTGSAKGKLDKITYPTSTGGVRVEADYAYDAWGFLDTVKDGNAPTTVFYELFETDALGRERHAEFGNGLDEVRDYDDANRMLAEIDTGPNETSTIQQLDFFWDKIGNLETREDDRQSVHEDFTYGDINRLLTAKLNDTTTSVTLAYSAGGNIDSKSDVGTGTYTYGTTSHAVTSISGSPGQSFEYDANGNMDVRNGDAITWFSYNKPKKINYGSDYAEFEYGAYRHRTKQVAKTGSTTITTYYIGPHFEKEYDGTDTVYRHNILVAGQAVAIRARPTTGEVTTTYVHRDHENNIVVMTDEDAAVLQRFSYDAFGKRRNLDWTADTSGARFTDSHITERGYTGHEHLDNTRLIHMNGRVQDPITGRMISADPYVPDPLNGQAFNHYSYVFNNPLSLIDPSGYGPDDPSPRHPDDDGCIDPAACALEDRILNPNRNRRKEPADLGDSDGSIRSAARGIVLRGCVGPQAAGCSVLVVGGVLVWIATNDTNIEVVESHKDWTRLIYKIIWEMHKSGVFSTDDTDEDGEPINPDVADTPSVPTPPMPDRDDDVGGREQVEAELSKLPRSKGRGVRTVGSEDELAQVFGRMTRGGKPDNTTSYPGSRVILKDGTFVSMRPVSRSGGATIDIIFPNGRNLRVHIRGK